MSAPTKSGVDVRPKIAIIGAGASGLMCADYLSQFDADVHIFEQMPTAGRKILWAGKTGLNISHNEPIDQFITRYSHRWLEPYVRRYDAKWLQNWAKNLGIETFVGSSGRIFPTQMKASPLLRAWLSALHDKGVEIFCRHKCCEIDGGDVVLQIDERDHVRQTRARYDVIVLACGGLSYPQLGSTGDWQRWLSGEMIEMPKPSNVGICVMWSAFMNAFFGQPLKRVRAWTQNGDDAFGDVMISHYGLEGGVIYQLNRALRTDSKMVLHLDLLPTLSVEKIHDKLNLSSKLSLNTRLLRLGLDKCKIALLKECTDKEDWQANRLAAHIKNLKVVPSGFRPLQEAISTAGGVKQSALTNHFQLKTNPQVFCTGEMLDWDAPTGGYLLTACFAMGRGCGEEVAQYLNLRSR